MKLYNWIYILAICNNTEDINCGLKDESKIKGGENKVTLKESLDPSIGNKQQSTEDVDIKNDKSEYDYDIIFDDILY